MASAPSELTAPVQPKEFIETEVMDYAAALTITLPKNTDLQKITVYLDNTGEPAEGYLGDELVQHCKKWMTLKNIDEIIEKLQGLMYSKIIICAATQTASDKEWTKYQNSKEYLYGFDQPKINIYKCPSRGANYVDDAMWEKSKFKKEEIKQSIDSNKKINRGGTIATTSTAPIQITFNIKPKKGSNDTESKITTTSKVARVREKEKELRLTQSQIEYRRHKAVEEQKKINQSQSQKGQKAWKWKQNVDKKKEQFKKEQQEKRIKERKEKAKLGGADGVVTKYAHFDSDIDPNSKTKVSASMVQYDDEKTNYPPGSDDIKFYNAGMTVSVWDNSKKEWVDGEVLEVIKFVKTMKIKYSGKTKQFRPNVNLVRLKY